MTLVIAFMFMTSVVQAQDGYRKLNRRYQRAYYKRTESKLSRACNLLGRKHAHVPGKSILAFHRKPKVSNAERSSVIVHDTDVSADVAKTKPVVKQEPKPQAPQQVKQAQVVPKAETVSEQKLETLHHKEDDILANNKLPVPTSAKHEEIRKKVAEELKKKPLTQPLQLAPLYFQFNQDEFSVVDMEPFLVAVEYALQGHTVLIEGHTDNRGQDDYNVKLSVKRVQRIRQLMLDMGVPDDRISVMGYGEELTKEKGKNEEEHQNNRRVDFTVF